MSDLTSVLKQSADKTVINLHPDTGVTHVDPEGQAAQKLHEVAQETVGGSVRGNLTPMSAVTGEGHEQFNTPSNQPSDKPVKPEKFHVSDTRRWNLFKMMGRRKNGTR